MAEPETHSLDKTIHSVTGTVLRKLAATAFYAVRIISQPEQWYAWERADIAAYETSELFKKLDEEPAKVAERAKEFLARVKA